VTGADGTSPELVDVGPSDGRPTMMQPRIEVLLARTGYSKFTLAVLAGRRAREVNAYFNQLTGELGATHPPQVQSNSTKPLTIALEEIGQGRITAVPADSADSEPGAGGTADGGPPPESAL
jgi:DNA-directed RNA polymerase subunit omega